MESRALYIRVGALIVLATAVLVGLLLFFGGAHLSRGQTYETYFRESVQGLEVGAAVKFRGVTLGQVSEIGLVSAVYGNGIPNPDVRAQFQQVLVRYVIDTEKISRSADISAMVGQGLRARLASQGLTGLTYIELDFVDPQRFPMQPPSWTPQNPYLPSMPSTLTQVQDAAQVLLQRLEKVDLGALSEGLIGLIGDVRNTLREGELHAVLIQMHDLLATTQEELKAADLPRLSAELRDTAAAYREVAQGKPMTDLIANADVATKRLAAASAQLPALIDNLDKLSRRVNAGTADVQSELDPILRDVRAAVANLRDTTESLKRDPSQILLGGPPPRDR